jgi:hypothetical protein
MIFRKFVYQIFFQTILLTIFPSIVFAQTEVFLSKPDTNIFKVIGIEQSTESTNDTALIMEYNRNGLLISESVPKYYFFIDYRYDDENRLTEKEALYGESFSNGTTFYSYSNDTIIEKSFLMISFRKNIKVLNKEKQVSSEITYYAAGQSSESYIEHMNYNYTTSGKPNRIDLIREYHDYSKEVEDYYEMDEDLIISELESAEKTKVEKTYTEFNYKSGLPTSEITINSATGKKLLEKYFKYDKKSYLLEKKEITYNASESEKSNSSPKKTKVINRYKYDIKGQLIENMQTSKSYSTIKLYKDGKLIKETEVFDNKKLEGTVVTYQYVYY